MSYRGLLACAVAGAALFAAGGAAAQSLAYTAPNVITAAGATSVSIGGASFVNHGMVGTARLPANLHDFNGETLGSFSGMAIDLATWRRSDSGAYTASLYTLPDRGPNNVGGLTTTNYASRLNKFTMSLNPYTGSATLASNVQQMTLTQDGGFLLRDATGQTFTGRDPQSGVVVRGGIAYPTPPAGDPGAGKISMDAEAVAFMTDGSFYVGDEYAAGIYYFDAQGRQLGAIQANPDLLPRVNGAINFNGANDAPLVAGSTGRRSNQGMEGLAVSPDGTRLVAVLQSAALQDNPTNVAARRNNTRVLIYDIAQNRTPTAPVAEYVLQLPVFINSATGVGATATTTAAQSEVLALNNTQFLVLSRDGNGRGTNGNANAIAYKSVLLVDVAGATNIAGTTYATGTNPTPISTTAAANGSGALVAGIVPVQQVELVNILNSTQLAKFGINTRTNPSTQYTLSEKWEAMALAPVLEEAAPHDFFLIIGNDNDFVSSDIDAAGVTNANTALTSATAGVGDNDNTMMVYRLSLPTYIDPQALAYLKATAPLAMANAGVAGARIGAASTLAGIGQLGMLRRGVSAGAAFEGVRGWGEGAFDRVGAPGRAGTVDAGGFSVGVDAGSATFRYGAALSASSIDGDGDDDFDIDGRSYSGAVYAGMFSPTGFYVQAGAGFGNVRLDVSRPAAYGLTAEGRAEGEVISLGGQAGYAFSAEGLGRIGPFVDVQYSRVSLDGYTERGASLGNAVIPDGRYDRLEGTGGLEASFNVQGAIRPSFRVGYTVVDEGGDRSGMVRLIDLAATSSIVTLPNYSKGFVSGEAALEGEAAGFGWRAAVGARGTAGDTSMSASFGLSRRF